MEHAAPPSPATGNPHYNVKRSVVIAQSDTMRVIDITLAPGECIQWHLHPDNEDYVIVLNGTVEIREYHPDKTVTLGPLERYVVPRKRPHTNVNVSSADCQFLVVQGPGKVEFQRLAKLDERAAAR
jgi:mannose-6-phosphate isomerase-like protein (cupin superfamily)